jgi:hypothetical protein
MTPTEQEILALLKCKRHLDDVDVGGGIDLEQLIEAKCLWWLIEAVELLLRHQLELREELRIRLGSVSPPDAPWWDSTRPPDKP